MNQSLKDKITELQPFVGKKVIHRHSYPTNRFKYPEGWEYKTEDREVILMAVVKDCSMVRRPHCMAYVAKTKDIFARENEVSKRPREQANPS